MKDIDLNFQNIFSYGVLQLLYFIFLEAAPFILLGLILVGWIRVLLPVNKIERYLGRNNLASAFYAAVFGIPLPVCSCSAIPVSLGLKEKKAGRESILSFLISAPETSIDTVIFTWGLLGPFFAVFRPLTAFVTSMFTAALSIAERTDKEGAEEPGTESPAITPQAVELLPKGRAGCVNLFKEAARYSFRDSLDNMSIWFVTGIVISAVIGAFLPDNVFEKIPGGQAAEIFFMLIIGIPMYVCSLESTPIAAILMLKGLSPGAALVFLLAGPATNISVIIMLLKFYGRKFTGLYLAGITIVTTAAGFLLNFIVIKTGVTIRADYFTGGSSAVWSVIGKLSAGILLILLVTSIRRLIIAHNQDLRKKGRDLAVKLMRMHPLRKASAAAAAIYLLSGFYFIQPGHEGFCLRMGKMERAHIGAGIHYRLPFPFERIETHPVSELKCIELGYHMTEAVLQRWRDRKLPRTGTGWHSFFTNAMTDDLQSSFLLGDENQIDAKFSIHYRLSEPVDYYYSLESGDRIIALAAENIVRRQLAAVNIDDILTTERAWLPTETISRLQLLLDSWDAGVEILAVNIVDLHPPVEAVSSFRDVASAMEDRETLIHNAYTSRESSLPNARGRSQSARLEAESCAVEMKNEAETFAKTFSSLSENYSRYQEETEFRLYLESMEENLSEKRKIILPSGSASIKNLQLWEDFPKGPNDEQPE